MKRNERIAQENAMIIAAATLGGVLSPITNTWRSKHNVSYQTRALWFMGDRDVTHIVNRMKKAGLVCSADPTEPSPLAIVLQPREKKIVPPKPDRKCRKARPRLQRRRKG